MENFVMYIILLIKEPFFFALFCFSSHDDGLDVLVQGVIRPFGFVDLVERLAPHPRSHPCLNDIHSSHSTYEFSNFYGKSLEGPINHTLFRRWKLEQSLVLAIQHDEGC